MILDRFFSVRFKRRSIYGKEPFEASKHPIHRLSAHVADRSLMKDPLLQ
jgi:hypothetical protein